MVADRHWRWSLAASFTLHAALLAVVSTWGARILTEGRPVDRPDWWAGSTLEIHDIVGVARAGEAASTDDHAVESPSNGDPEADPTEPESDDVEPEKNADDESAPAAVAPPDEYGDSWLPDPIDDVTPEPTATEPSRRGEVDDARDARRGPDADAGAGASGSVPEPPAAVARSRVDGADGGEDRGGSFGAQGLPAGVRNLAKAFTRALPIAGYHDPIWTSLPTGAVGTATVTIHVDDDGRISRNDVADETPSSLRELLRKTFLHLKIGRFALARGDVTAGSERLHVAIALSDREALDEGAGVQIGFDAPKPGAPGRGYFTLTSGRHFDAMVTIEASDPAPGKETR